MWRIPTATSSALEAVRRRADRFSQRNTFLQLATLVREPAVKTDRLEVAQSLARLARVGIEPLTR